MSKISDLLDAITEYQEQRHEHDKARDNCQYDWGYFGQTEIERLERAEKRVDAALEAYLDKER